MLKYFKWKLYRNSLMKKLAILYVLITSMILSITSFQITYADSYQDKLSFASSLEETLGHFWAIEQNLDENNAKLALVHATHPIAELYSTMKPSLKEANPEFDAKIQKTLMELGQKTGSGVTRKDAQIAIDDAKKIIQEARLLVVGEELSQDTSFNVSLIQELLKTSSSEYEEGVKNGQIEMMAEFQDGSAFVWRSQKIFDDIKSNLPEDDAKEIEDFYSDLWNVYKKRSDPQHVATLANGITTKIDAAIGQNSDEIDYLTYIENIRNLLNQVKTTYAQGDKDSALGLATTAYLDNFEFLESPLKDAGQRELVDEVETLMRIELRDMITNDVPASEVNQQIDVILEKIDTVAKVVPEFGTLAMMILAVAVISIVAITAKSRLILRV